MLWGVGGGGADPTERHRVDFVGDEGSYNAARLSFDDPQFSLAPFFPSHLEGNAAGLINAVQLPDGEVIALVRQSGSSLALVSVGFDSISLLTYLDSMPPRVYGMRPVGSDSIAVLLTNANHGSPYFEDNKYLMFRVIFYGRDGAYLGDIYNWQTASGTNELSLASSENVGLWHIDNQNRLLLTIPDQWGESSAAKAVYGR
ncbi:MAG: hypothetical protein LR015_11345 [Verrucomicrobia bacterium]|nr:hypothetical protein [Verrucomicrobiota bacterium]